MTVGLYERIMYMLKVNTASLIVVAKVNRWLETAHLLEFQCYRIMLIHAY